MEEALSLNVLYAALDPVAKTHTKLSFAVGSHQICRPGDGEDEDSRTDNEHSSGTDKIIAISLLLHTVTTSMYSSLS